SGPGTGTPAATQSSGGDELRNELVRELLTDVNQIQGKQEAVDSQLLTMKRENEALWREVAFLRRKHREQQQIVEKLIRFLVTLVHQARAGTAENNISMKRKPTLMIDAGGKVRKMFQGPVRQKTLDSGITELDSEGPIIRDVTYDPVSPQNGPSPLGATHSARVQKVMSAGRNKQLIISQGGKVVRATMNSPAQMEANVLVTSPGSMDADLCDASDEVPLCDNLFDADVLSPALADASSAPSADVSVERPASASPSSLTAAATNTTSERARSTTASPALDCVTEGGMTTNLVDVLDEPFGDTVTVGCSSPTPPSSVLNTPLVEWADPEPGPSGLRLGSRDTGKGMEVALQSPMRAVSSSSGSGKLQPASQNGGLQSTTVVLPPATARGSGLGGLAGPTGPGGRFAGATTTSTFPGPATKKPRLLSEKYTDCLSDHCDGVDTELDWLQDQLLAGGLNIDTSTLMGIFSADDILPGLTGDVSNLGGSQSDNSNGVSNNNNNNNSQVVTYQTPSFLDLISDETDDERSVKLKVK
ncbi:heat shock factor protein-like, partial [Tropilaelaps mercedesae]